MRLPIRTTLEATIFITTALLATSLFLPWVDQSAEFVGGPSAFQRGGPHLRLAVLMLLLVAIGQIALLAIGHLTAPRAEFDAVAVISLVMTGVALALAVIVYMALGPPRFSDRGIGAYLGIAAATAAFLAAVALRVVRVGGATTNTRDTAAP